MLVMGIESSCDETACAIVSDKRELLSSVVWSQYDEHRRFGGVVPEIAARAHLEQVDVIVQEAMTQAGVDFEDLSAVAVAGGPGLIGGVMVGVMTAKAIALAHNLPFVAVNHLEGHALMARFTNDVEFPYLLMLTSGGHCQNLERAALHGNPKRFILPYPMKGRVGCDFSFSGLKTAVRHQIEELQKNGPLSEQDKADMSASFQRTVVSVISDRLKNGIAMFKEKYPQGKHLVVSGGVAANTSLRDALQGLAAKNKMIFAAPPLKLCTDNGVMIAWAGVERYRLGKTSGLDFKARPRWPLDKMDE